MAKQKQETVADSSLGLLATSNTCSMTEIHGIIDGTISPVNETESMDTYAILVVHFISYRTYMFAESKLLKKMFLRFYCFSRKFRSSSSIVGGVEQSKKYSSYD